jgi:6-phosphogluconate dehydrogenase
MLKKTLGFTNEQIHHTFAEWNKGELDSYLIDITKDIFTVKDKETGEYLVDIILDTAGAKGTGKWMSQLALDIGAPSSLVTEAVYARCISAMKEARVHASKVLNKYNGTSSIANPSQFVEQIRQALYASKICSYAQGYVQMQAAAKEYDWALKFGEIAMLWRGGCIIRAVFLERIKEAFDKNPNLENLLLDPYFQNIVENAQGAWRNVIKTAIDFGVPVPAFSTALSYFDSYRSANLPANLLQAQRDYFGAHTYRRTDKPNEGPFHTDWINEKK